MYFLSLCNRIFVTTLCNFQSRQKLRNGLFQHLSIWRADVMANSVSERNVSNCVSSSRYTCMDLHDRCVEMKKYTGRRASFLGGGSPIALRLTLPTIYHTWMFSKELCPWTERGVSSGRKFSNWSIVYSSMNDPGCKTIPGRTNDLCKRSSRRRDPRRRFSSEGTSCNKTTKPGECHDQTTSAGRREGEVAKDCSATKCDTSSRLPTAEFYPECSTPCEPSVKDPCCKPRPPPSCPPSAFTSPCPNVEDYCKEGNSRGSWAELLFSIYFIASCRSAG